MTDLVSVGGRPIVTRRWRPRTSKLTFAEPYAPGVRLLDALPIYPRHALEAALEGGTFAEAWGLKTPPADMPCLGPFVLRSYTPGQRVVLDRNPRYWRRDASGMALPYLDRLTLEIVPDRNAEALRLVSGQVDVLQDQIRADDYRDVKQAADAGARAAHGRRAQPRSLHALVQPGLERPTRPRVSCSGRLPPGDLAGGPSARRSPTRCTSARPIRRRSRCRRPTRTGCPTGCAAGATIRRAPRRCSTASACSIAITTASARTPRAIPSGSACWCSRAHRGEKGMEFVRDQLANVGVGLDVVADRLRLGDATVAEGRLRRHLPSPRCRRTRIRRRTWTGGCRAATCTCGTRRSRRRPRRGKPRSTR